MKEVALLTGALASSLPASGEPSNTCNQKQLHRMTMQLTMKEVALLTGALATSLPTSSKLLFSVIWHSSIIAVPKCSFACQLPSTTTTAPLGSTAARSSCLLQAAWPGPGESRAAHHELSLNVLHGHLVHSHVEASVPRALWQLCVPPKHADCSQRDTALRRSPGRTSHLGMRRQPSCWRGAGRQHTVEESRTRLHATLNSGVESLCCCRRVGGASCLGAHRPPAAGGADGAEAQRRHREGTGRLPRPLRQV